MKDLWKQRASACDVLKKEPEHLKDHIPNNQLHHFRPVTSPDDKNDLLLSWCYSWTMNYVMMACHDELYILNDAF